MRVTTFRSGRVRTAYYPKIAPPQNVSTVEQYRELVTQLRQVGVEVAAIHQRLGEQGYNGSYALVHRFVQRLEPSTPQTTVRVETRPGEEAQVDFGYAGRMQDSETETERKSWAFVMTLSWSRHQYVEFVFDQQVATWLRCHRNAFQFFKGVPERVVIDNLKLMIRIDSRVSTGPVSTQRRPLYVRRERSDRSRPSAWPAARCGAPPTAVTYHRHVGRLSFR